MENVEKYGEKERQHTLGTRGRQQTKSKNVTDRKVVASVVLLDPEEAVTTARAAAMMVSVVVVVDGIYDRQKMGGERKYIDRMAVRTAALTVTARSGFQFRGEPAGKRGITEGCRD